MHKDKMTRLRTLLRGEAVARIAGGHTPVSARLVEAHGFDAIWASGLEISTSFGVPDAGVLTMTELLDAARLMTEATRIPVVADCDTGFGERRNVVHMVRRYEAAGVAGVCIEDKRFPKLNSFVNGDQTLAPVEEFADKIKAAKDTQEHPDFTVIARVEALIAGLEVEEALARAHAYAEAGADAVLIHSKESSPRQVFAFAQLWQNRLPLIAVPTTYYRTPLAEFGAAGIKAVIYANHAIRAAVKAMDETLAEISAGDSTASVENKIAPLVRLFELQGMEVPTAPTKASAAPGRPVKGELDHVSRG